MQELKIKLKISDQVFPFTTNWDVFLGLLFLTPQFTKL